MKDYEVIFEDDLQDYDFDPWMDAVLNGINILSNMQFSRAFVKNGELAGAMFTSADRDSFSFDIFVSKNHRGRGLAKKLVDAAVSEYREHREGYDRIKLEVHVVSPTMKELLKGKGFRVKKILPDETCMMYLPSNIDGNKSVKNKILRNPPSKGFRDLGHGFNASAYVDNENQEVELIVRARNINVVNGDATYDLSREILINLRNELPTAFMKYMPEIKRSRIEFSDKMHRIGDILYRLPEIIYSMPVYEEISGNNKEIVENIIMYIKSGLTSPTDGIPNDLIIVSKYIVISARKYQSNTDPYTDNFSQTKDGTIIFRDLLVLLSDGFNGLKISDCWPRKYSDIFSKMMVAKNWNNFLGKIIPKGTLINRGNVPSKQKVERQK